MRGARSESLGPHFRSKADRKRSMRFPEMTASLPRSVARDRPRVVVDELLDKQGAEPDDQFSGNAPVIKTERGELVSRVLPMQESLRQEAVGVMEVVTVAMGFTEQD